MSSPSLTGYSPNTPLRYLGPNVALPIIVVRNREPTGADIKQPNTGKYYSFGTLWLVGETSPGVAPVTGVRGEIWYLSYISNNVAVWTSFGGSFTITSVTGTNGVSAAPSTGNVIVSGINATTSTVGVASFDPLDFTVSAGGEVSLIGTNPDSYVDVTFAMSPYTVLPTDYFISVDSTLGPVVINLPDSPTPNKKFIVKDRLGKAQANNVTVKSLTGASTIDTEATYIFVDNFESLECWFQGSNYEIF